LRGKPFARAARRHRWYRWSPGARGPGSVQVKRPAAGAAGPSAADCEQAAASCFVRHLYPCKDGRKRKKIQ
jgi:hypothetical protein